MRVPPSMSHSTQEGHSELEQTLPVSLRHLAYDLSLVVFTVAESAFQCFICVHTYRQSQQHCFPIALSCLLLTHYIYVAMWLSLDYDASTLDGGQSSSSSPSSERTGCLASMKRSLRGSFALRCLFCAVTLPLLFWLLPCVVWNHRMRKYLAAHGLRLYLPWNNNGDHHYHPFNYHHSTVHSPSRRRRCSFALCCPFQGHSSFQSIGDGGSLTLKSPVLRGIGSSSSDSPINSPTSAAGRLRKKKTQSVRNEDLALHMVEDVPSSDTTAAVISPVKDAGSLNSIATGDRPSMNLVAGGMDEHTTGPMMTTSNEGKSIDTTDSNGGSNCTQSGDISSIPARPLSPVKQASVPKRSDSLSALLADPVLLEDPAELTPEAALNDRRMKQLRLSQSCWVYTMLSMQNTDDQGRWAAPKRRSDDPLINTSVRKGFSHFLRHSQKINEVWLAHGLLCSVPFLMIECSLLTGLSLDSEHWRRSEGDSGGVYESRGQGWLMWPVLLSLMSLLLKTVHLTFGITLVQRVVIYLCHACDLILFVPTCVTLFHWKHTNKHDSDHPGSVLRLTESGRPLFTQLWFDLILFSCLILVSLLGVSVLGIYLHYQYTRSRYGVKGGWFNQSWQKKLLRRMKKVVPSLLFGLIFVSAVCLAMILIFGVLCSILSLGCIAYGLFMERHTYNLWHSLLEFDYMNWVHSSFVTLCGCCFQNREANQKKRNSIKNGQSNETKNKSSLDTRRIHGSSANSHSLNEPSGSSGCIFGRCAYCILGVCSKDGRRNNANRKGTSSEQRRKLIGSTQSILDMNVIPVSEESHTPPLRRSDAMPRNGSHSQSLSLSPLQAQMNDVENGRMMNHNQSESSLADDASFNSNLGTTRRGSLSMQLKDKYDDMVDSTCIRTMSEVSVPRLFVRHDSVSTISWLGMGPDIHSVYYRPGLTNTRFGSSSSMNNNYNGDDRDNQRVIPAGDLTRVGEGFVSNILKMEHSWRIVYRFLFYGLSKVDEMDENHGYAMDDADGFVYAREVRDPELILYRLLLLNYHLSIDNNPHFRAVLTRLRQCGIIDRTISVNPESMRDLALFKIDLNQDSIDLINQVRERVQISGDQNSASIKASSPVVLSSSTSSPSTSSAKYNASGTIQKMKSQMNHNENEDQRKPSDKNGDMNSTHTKNSHKNTEEEEEYEEDSATLYSMIPSIDEVTRMKQTGDLKSIVTVLSRKSYPYWCYHPWLNRIRRIRHTMHCLFVSPYILGVYLLVPLFLMGRILVIIFPVLSELMLLNKRLNGNNNGGSSSSHGNSTVDILSLLCTLIYVLILLMIALLSRIDLFEYRRLSLLSNYLETLECDDGKNKNSIDKHGSQYQMSSKLSNFINDVFTLQCVLPVTVHPKIIPRNLERIQWEYQQFVYFPAYERELHSMIGNQVLVAEIMSFLPQNYYQHSTCQRNS